MIRISQSQHDLCTSHAYSDLLQISFSPTVTLGPITVGIDISRPPSLLIKGGLNVAVSGQAAPLVLTMGLNATVTSVSGFA